MTTWIDPNDYQDIPRPVVAIGNDYETVWCGFRPDLLAEHCLDPED